MSDTRRLLELLTPRKTVSLRMERWGPNADGGYVVPAELMHSGTLLLTGGIADDLRFEADVAQRVPGICFVMFDHTIAALPGHTPNNATWHRLGLAAQDSNGFVSLDSAAALAKLTSTDSLILKLDIEGAEWDVLESVSDSLLDRVAVLIIEFHDFSRREEWHRYRQILERLHTRLRPVHVHGNNHSTIRTIHRYDVQIPEVLEVTFVPRKFALLETWDHDAPTTLDFPNQPGVKDYSFNYWSDLDRRFRRQLVRRFARAIGLGRG